MHHIDLLSHSHDMVWVGHCDGGRITDAWVWHFSKDLIMSITMAAVFLSPPDASMSNNSSWFTLIPASRWLAHPLILFTGTATQH